MLGPHDGLDHGKLFLNLLRFWTESIGKSGIRSCKDSAEIPSIFKPRLYLPGANPRPQTL